MNDRILKILSLGLSPEMSTEIDKRLKRFNVRYKMHMIQNVSDLDECSKGFDAIFYYSGKNSQKLIENVKKLNHLHPKSALILLTSRLDMKLVINSFRFGAFDILNLPLDDRDINVVFNRLKLFGVFQAGVMGPERAVLQLFSHPESFSDKLEVSSQLQRYLDIFFYTGKSTVFKISEENIASLSKKLKLTQVQMKKIQAFVNDEYGLIFGLRFIKNKFHFLLKDEDNVLKYIVLENKSNWPIRDIVSEYLSNVIKTSLSILEENKKRLSILELSMTDEVTSLFNQRKLLEDLEYYMARFKQDKIGFSLLFIDIDYFKTVNDRFGHVIGSQLLIDLANVLKSQLRDTDLVYRYGGDEFIVLLPDANIDLTKKIAIRISEKVKAETFKITNGPDYNLSLSIGIARFPEDADSAKSIINFADEMMYLSKKSGRGKVFHVTEVNKE